MNRQEIIEAEMDSSVNPLIAGGEAARKAEADALASDTGFKADEERLLSPLFNPLLPGSTLTVEAMDAHYDALSGKDFDALSPDEKKFLALYKRH